MPGINTTKVCGPLEIVDCLLKEKGIVSIPIILLILIRSKFCLN